MIQFYLPISHFRKARHLSERQLVSLSALSRGAVRQLERPEEGNPTVGSIGQLAQYFDRDVEVVLSSPDTLPEYSVIAAALKVERDGFDSWKIHFFDFVDEFRRTTDARLLILPPPASLEKRLAALLASIVRDLCDEVGISTPGWALRRLFLDRPWFVSGIESLKATAILESPMPYRANNIFVHDNFLSRA